MREASRKTARYCISSVTIILSCFLQLHCRTVPYDLLKAHSDLQFSRFEANPLLKSITIFLRIEPGIVSGSHQKRSFKTDCPPCFAPIILMGFSFFLRCCKIASKKQGRFLECHGAAISGSNNVICSANSPAILKKKARKMGCFPHGYTLKKQGRVIS